MRDFLGVENFCCILTSKFLTKQNCTHKVVCHRYAAYLKIPGMLSGGFLAGASLTFCIVTVVMIYTRNTLCGIIGGHGIRNLQKRQEERNLTFGKLSEKGSIDNNTWGSVELLENFEDNLKNVTQRQHLQVYIFTFNYSFIS